MHTKNELELNILLDNANKYLDGNAKIIALNLVDKLLFMENVLNTLEDEINRNGVIENFRNGKQEFIRESQALKSYNNTIKNYQKLIIQIKELIPNGSNKKIIDEE